MSTENAMTLPAVFACIRLLSSTVGSLPLNVYRTGSNGRTLANSTPLGLMLNGEASPEMSAGELWEVVMVHLNLYGNAFIYKVRVNGVVKELHPILPTRVQVQRDGNGDKLYLVQNSGGTVPLTDRDFIHIRATGVTGLVGLSPITQMRQTLGVYGAHEEYEGRYYGNNAQPGGILTLPEGKALDDDGIRRLREQWEASQKGLRNAGKVAVLEEGTTFTPLSIPLGDQQFIEQKRFSVQEVCRIFNVPAFMLGEASGDSLTYSNTEQMADYFLKFCVRPWLTRIERELNRDGDLTGDPNLYAKFDMDELLRADLATRYAAYSLAIKDGWMSRNEVRVREDLNAAEGLDVYLQSTQAGTAQPS